MMKRKHISRRIVSKFRQIIQNNKEHNKLQSVGSWWHTRVYSGRKVQWLVGLGHVQRHVRQRNTEPATSVHSASVWRTAVSRAHRWNTQLFRHFLLRYEQCCCRHPHFASSQSPVSPLSITHFSLACSVLALCKKKWEIKKRKKTAVTKKDFARMHYSNNPH